MIIPVRRSVGQHFAGGQVAGRGVQDQNSGAPATDGLDFAP